MKHAILFAAVLTVARSSSAAAVKGADAMIAKGLELRRAGRSLEAVEILQQANEIAATPRSAGQLGLAQSAVERWDDAEQHLNTSLASPRDPWVKNHRGVLEQALALVESHMGQIALTGPAGAAIVIAGKVMGTLPLRYPVRVDAGSALVAATAPGFKRFEMPVPVEAGKETRVEIAFEPIALPPVPAAPAPTPVGISPLQAREIEPQSTWRTWAGASLIGVGLGAATWGIVWIAIDHDPSGGACSAGAPTDCVPIYNTKTAGYVLTGAGVAATAVGGALFYIGRPHPGQLSVAAGPSSLFLTGHF